MDNSVDNSNLEPWEQDLLTPLSVETIPHRDLGFEGPLMEDDNFIAPLVPERGRSLKVESALSEFREAKAKAPKPPQVIPAPLPVPLHQVKFPVYDRGAAGYRIIERAFGTAELKTLVKVSLDALLSGDPAAAVDPSFVIDATWEANGKTPPSAMHPERMTAQWKCRHRRRTHVPPNPSELLDKSIHSSYTHSVREFSNGIEACIEEANYYRTDSTPSAVNPGGGRIRLAFIRHDPQTIHASDELWAFYEDHAPFMQYDTSRGIWQPKLPDEWMYQPTSRGAMPEPF